MGTFQFVEALDLSHGTADPTRSRDLTLF